MNEFVPCLVRCHRGSELESITLGHRLLDDYLAFVAVAGADQHVVGGGVGFEDLLWRGRQGADTGDAGGCVGVLAAQRAPRRGVGVVRLEDAELGLAGRTIARRLSSVRGLYAYLAARGDTGVSCNPFGQPGRPRPRCAAREGRGAVDPHPHTLPRVLAASEVDGLRAALRTHRDRAMVEAMLLGGLRRCEVLGLRLDDVNAGARRVFVAEGKGGRQRMVPVSARFFASLGDYLDQERPRASTDRDVCGVEGTAAW